MCNYFQTRKGFKIKEQCFIFSCSLLESLLDQIIIILLTYPLHVLFWKHKQFVHSWTQRLTLLFSRVSTWIKIPRWLVHFRSCVAKTDESSRDFFKFISKVVELKVSLPVPRKYTLQSNTNSIAHFTTLTSLPIQVVYCSYTTNYTFDYIWMWCLICLNFDILIISMTATVGYDSAVTAKGLT